MFLIKKPELHQRANKYTVEKYPKHPLPVFPPGSLPQFVFSSNRKEQKKELKENFLVQRFAQSRQQLNQDPYRPRYHFVNPEGTMNDPNGLCFWQGDWHLFYQASPPEDKRIHWGHATSSDLIHWQDLPYAIYPSPEECCYSGGTLVEEDRVIAMYHGTRAGNMVAVSSDSLLLNWHKLSGRPVIPMSASSDKEYGRWHAPDGSSLPYSVFDPCIWKKDGLYYSLTGGRLPQGPGGKLIPAHFLFRSSNLIDWEYLHPFVENDRFTLIGDDGACPYFLPIGDRYILFFYSHMSGGQAFLGDYDKIRDMFVVTEHYQFNFGAHAPGGVHAPSASPHPSGGVVVIFNMNPAHLSYRRRQPNGHLGQAMTLPRHLTLYGQNELGMEPVKDVQSLRYNHQQIGSMELLANQEVFFHTIKGKELELIIEIEALDVPMIALNVFQSPGKEEFTRISIFPERGYRNRGHRREGPPYSMISIDSSFSSQDADAVSRPPEVAPVLLQKGDPLQLHVFLDRSIVEVFVNGKQSLAVRVYPSREDSSGVSLLSQGRSAFLHTLQAWQMKSIYH